MYKYKYRMPYKDGYMQLGKHLQSLLHEIYYSGMYHTKKIYQWQLLMVHQYGIQLITSICQYQQPICQISVHNYLYNFTNNFIKSVFVTDIHFVASLADTEILGRQSQYLKANLIISTTLDSDHLCRAHRGCSLVAMRYFSSVTVSSTTSLLLLITWRGGEEGIGHGWRGKEK